MKKILSTYEVDHKSIPFPWISNCIAIPPPGDQNFDLAKNQTK